MGNVFGWAALSSAQINAESLALRKALDYSWPGPQKPPQPAHNRQSLQTTTGEHLIMSGSLWADSSITFRPQFLQANKKFYEFETHRMPAAKEAAQAAMSNWVLQQTGMAFPAIDFPGQDDFVLLDTTWFKGAWVDPFVPSATHPGDFTLLSGTKKTLPMMSKSKSFEYLKGSNFQAVVLNYWNAEMYVFLPDEGSSLAEFEQSLTAENWAAWTGEFASHRGYLELPKFQSEYQGDSRAVLESLGLNSAFKSFSSLAPAVRNTEGAKLQRSISTVLLKVDEKGTEVVSVGINGGVPGGVSANPPPPFRMIVNRPFFFAIEDRKTKALLYLGAVVEPLG